MQSSPMSVQTNCRYNTPSNADTIAVAVYDKIDKQDAKAANRLVVVFNNALYTPPLEGIADTTSWYTLRKKNNITVTNNKPTGLIWYKN